MIAKKHAIWIVSTSLTVIFGVPKLYDFTRGVTDRYVQRKMQQEQLTRQVYKLRMDVCKLDGGEWNMLTDSCDKE